MLLASPMSIYDSHVVYSQSKESLVFGRSLGYGMVLFGDKSSYSKTENTLLKSGACSSSLGLQHWFHSSTHCQMRQKASNVYWTKKVFSSFLSSYVVDEQNVVVFKDWVRYRNEVHTVGTKSEASFSDQHIVVQWGVCPMEWRASRILYLTTTEVQIKVHSIPTWTTLRIIHLPSSPSCFHSSTRPLIVE